MAKKLTKTQKEAQDKILAIIDNLSIENVNFLDLHAVIEKRLRERYSEWYISIEHKNHAEQMEKERERKRREQERRAEKITRWVAGNVNVGDIVKMSGTRDSHGVRRVEEIKDEDGTLVCRAYTKTMSQTCNDMGHIPDLARSKGPMRLNVVFYIRPQLTEHQFDKVVAILRNGNMCRLDEIPQIKR